jgi:3-hydroxybutyryl-CoA dehydrogenase
MTTIGVVGAGAMGRGICQWALEAGTHVVVFDAKVGAAQDARSFIADMLSRAVAKGKLTSINRDATISRLEVAESLANFAGADIVIEAIVEDIDVKRKLFGEVESIIPDDAILCTNTSSLSVTGCARDCRIPARVAGLHFFNPAPLMKVVEVIRGERTSPEVVNRLLAIIGKSQHKAIVCEDTPGLSSITPAGGFRPKACGSFRRASPTSPMLTA